MPVSTVQPRRGFGWCRLLVRCGLRCNPVASLVIFGKIVIRWKGASSAASRSLHDARPITVVK
eukprot:COSAG01_NODE_37721_length_499_cov_3.537500_1_plen_62_part_10